MSDHVDADGVVTERPDGMPPAIAAAIVEVMAGVKALGSDERNTHGGYTYVSVDKFYDRIGKLMAGAGVALLIDEVSTDVKASEKSGAPWLFAQYELRFLHKSGALSHPLRRSIALPINGPQTYGAAQSYIEKQFLRQVFKVPTGEKDADDTPQTDSPPARSAAQGRSDLAGAALAASPAKPATTPAAQGTETKHPRYTEAVEFFKTMKQIVAAAPHTLALDQTLTDHGFDPTFELPPIADSKAALLLQVSPDAGYKAIGEMVTKRRSKLLTQGPTQAPDFSQETAP